MTTEDMICRLAELRTAEGAEQHEIDDLVRAVADRDRSARPTEFAVVWVVPEGHWLDPVHDLGFLPGEAGLATVRAYCAGYGIQAKLTLNDWPAGQVHPNGGYRLQ